MHIFTAAIATFAWTMMAWTQAGPGRAGGSPSTQAQVVTATISGVVTDATTRAPLAGVYVQLLGGPSQGGTSVSPPRKVTDGQGRFIFTGVQPGAGYSVFASKVGYIEGGYRRQAGDAQGGRIDLTEGQWRSDVNITLSRAASLAGSVFDARNEPIVEAPVILLRRVMVGGGSQWALQAASRTDDRGQYYFGNLPPHEYLVLAPHAQITLGADLATLGSMPRTTVLTSATGGLPTTTAPRVARRSDGIGTVIGAAPPPATPGMAFVGAFHPGVRTVEAATPIALTAGEVRLSVDVSLALSPTVSVSGTLAGPADAIAHMLVRLLPTGDAALIAGTEVAIGMTTATGAFTFPHVPPGDYRLVAGRAMTFLAAQGSSSLSPWLPTTNQGLINQIVSPNVVLSARTFSGPDATADMPLSVGKTSIADLVVPLQSGATLSGELRMDTGEPLKTMGPILPSVRLEPVTLSPNVAPRISALSETGQTTSRPTLAFVINHVTPGRYMLAAPVATSLNVVKAEANGRDLLDAPLEVEAGTSITNLTLTLSDTRTTVNGTVSGDSADAYVFVVPENRALWPYAGQASLRFRLTTVTNGAWTTTGLPPGRYLALAVPAADRQAVHDERYLVAATPRAVAFALEPGGTATIALRLPGGRQ